MTPSHNCTVIVVPLLSNKAKVFKICESLVIGLVCVMVSEAALLAGCYVKCRLGFSWVDLLFPVVYMHYMIVHTCH